VSDTLNTFTPMSAQSSVEASCITKATVPFWVWPPEEDSDDPGGAAAGHKQQRESRRNHQQNQTRNLDLSCFHDELL
jgi:hypothetical protein